MEILVPPDSSFYIHCARAGLEPFVELSTHAAEREFATCGSVVLEVCRGRGNPPVLQRFRERFAIMPFIAACALQANAAVLTADAHLSEIPGVRVLSQLK